MTGQAHNETRISTATAGSLQLAWSRQLGLVASSPTVVSGRVYVGDWNGNEWELDAATGAVIASTNLGQTLAGNCDPPDQGITSAPAFDGRRIYLAGGDDFFDALDPETLATLWRTKLGDNSPAGGYYGWSSPAIFAGRAIEGVASHCDDPFVRGEVLAMDVDGGTIAAMADLSQSDDPARFGAGVWSSPAIDLDAREVFVSTASAYAYDDGLAYSVVRLSADTLAIEDFWKITPEEYAATPDADWGSSPTLFSDAGGRLLFGAGHKNGFYYAFDRKNLSAGPVWKTSVATGGDCPTCGDGTISTAAYDGGRLYVGGGRGTSGGKSFAGSVSALDPSTGAVVWAFTGFDGPVLAPVSLANGVVFAAGGTFAVGLDAATGALLWKASTGSPMYGGIAISDGRIFFGATGGLFFAFEVPRTGP